MTQKDLISVVEKAIDNAQTPAVKIGTYAKEKKPCLKTVPESTEKIQKQFYQGKAWPSAQYIILGIDDKDNVDNDECIKKWQIFAARLECVQFLIIEVSAGEWQMFDGQAAVVAKDNKEIEDYFANFKPYIPAREFFQKIFFGTPGSGKSFKVSKIVEGQEVIRTTFHPDTDYASFVGSYKPVMNGAAISYDFVKQAFIKAYLAAWRKYVDSHTSKIDISFNNINGLYTITTVTKDYALCNRVYSFKKSDVSRIWGKPLYWNDDKFEIPSAPHSGASTAEAICDWIFKNKGKVDFEEGWNAFISEVEASEIFKCKAKSQEYEFKRSSERNKLIVTTYGNKSTKPTIKNEYTSEESNSNGIAAGIANILKKINPDDFDEAWKGLISTMSNIGNIISKPKSQFLVIEEINRGNCAQIFGDIFQLLDRQDNGFSVYPIESDSDLQSAISKAFSDEDEYKLSNKIDVDNVIDGYESNFGSSLSNDIQEGRVLLLPPNLSILATMNTSDQSLFPMDSAFKRRWAWEYVPINAGCPDSQFKVTIGDKAYKWASFLDKVNERIHKLSDSEDKQMGNFFIKSDIDVEEFKSKVMFYLWSEVCKEYEKSGSFFKDKNDNEAEFTFNSLFPTNDVTNKRLQGFMDYLGVEEA